MIIIFNKSGEIHPAPFWREDMQIHPTRLAIALALSLLLILTGCTPTAPTAGEDDLRVLAVTTITGDVVKAVAGDHITVSVFLPPGADPHSFEASPRDIALLADADLIFASGAGLEEFLTPLLENAKPQAVLISLSDDLELIEADSHEDEHEDEGEEHEGEEHEGEEHAHEGGDPHTWLDPHNVSLWTESIERALAELDPANAEAYAANAEAYRQELAALDEWIAAQVAHIPADRRKLVSDHTSLTYFAARYGFELVGAVIPGYSTTAEPSAQELARLEDTIRAAGVRAIFVEEEGNPRLAQRVAQDTGAEIVRLYIGSLSAPGGPASTYLDLMRYNVSAIVSGLSR
jgi:ABC-type Zn uptake system ZnuABC Zn-binding protein ZnuA